METMPAVDMSGDESIIPLEEALPYIRLELSAAKDSLALRKALMEDFVAARVVYDPFLVP